MNSSPSLILASRSPRRIELLSLITSDFEVMPSSFDESSVKIDNPTDLVRELSFRKAKTIHENNKNSIVIGCDTVVSLDNEIFGIPADFSMAKNMLEKLSGNTHSVITGVCVLKGNDVHQFECETRVTFFELSDNEICEYLETNEPFDKAGSYGIQGKGSLFVSSINGDYFNVVGLPISRLKRILDKIC